MTAATTLCGLQGVGRRRHHRFNQEGREAEGGQRSRSTRIKGVEEKAVEGVQEKAVEGVEEKAIKRKEEKSLTTIMIQIASPQAQAGKGLTVVTEKKGVVEEEMMKVAFVT